MGETLVPNIKDRKNRLHETGAVIVNARSTVLSKVSFWSRTDLWSRRNEKGNPLK